MSDYDAIRNNNEKSKSHCTKKMYAPNNEKILMHISNFRKVKRVEDVVEVFERVLKQIPCKLLLVGDGPERQKIEMICREKGIQNQVKFLGKITSPENILPIADLFLLTSETESFGLAALEAMACKLPVISSNAGGIPELNIDGVTGFLDEVGDIDGMAAHAIYILEDNARLQKFKENALAHAKTFDIKHIMPVYERYYEEVIEKSKSLIVR
jgi:N-acetyl-alpha-D-glucosaminyl L-malate synthase BshA